MRLPAVIAALAVLAALTAPPVATAADVASVDDAPSLGLIPRYLLRDPNGRAVTEGDFRGRFQLITFGYTFCPDVCPTTLVEMADILKRLGDAAARLQPIFVSVDPARDTPAHLKEYTRFFDDRIIGLTASPELVKAAADRFKVRYEIVREPGATADHYSVDHSAGMYLLGPDGSFLHKFAYRTPTEAAAAHIRDFMAAYARPPGREPALR